jgi:hypothetical protein
MKYIHLVVFVGLAFQSSGQAAAAKGKPAVNCNYQKCFETCMKIGGKYCNPYCTKEIAGRRVAGQCK